MADDTVSSTANDAQKVPTVGEVLLRLVDNLASAGLVDPTLADELRSALRRRKGR